MSLLTVIESTPKKTRDYEKNVAMFASEAMREAGQADLFSGPITLHAQFCFLMPESRVCKKHKEGCKKLHKGDPHTQRPDLDNLLKSIKDGMNQVVWVDDSMIYKFGRLEKIWSDVPGIVIGVVEESNAIE